MNETYLAALMGGIVALGVDRLVKNSYDHIYPEHNHKDPALTSLGLTIGAVLLIGLATENLPSQYEALTTVFRMFAMGIALGNFGLQAKEAVQSFRGKK